MNTNDIIVSHSHKFLEKLRDFRAESKFIDFAIYAGHDEREIKVHKCVMAACSEYFRAMWAFGNTDERSSVSLPEMDPDALETIVTFCYTNKIILSEENIHEVLSAASYLRIQSVQDICVRYLDKNINSNNCLTIAQIPDSYEAPELREKAYTFCMKHFESVIEEQEFLDLEYGILSRVIADEHLESDEAIIMTAVIKWCDYDKDVRMEYLYDLVKEVRLVSLEPEHLIDFSTRDPIQSSQKCKDLFAKAKDYLLLRAQPTRQKQLSQELNTHFRIGAKRHHIYALGGWQDEGKALWSAEVYRAETKTWERIPAMRKKRCGVGAATLNGVIYAVGGHDGHSWLKTVECFDTSTEYWTEVAELNYPRASLAVATVKNRIYAIGGQHPRATDCVEMFDPNTNVWQDRASMKIARFGAGVAVIGDFIYVTGGCGYDSINDKAIILNSVERYDTVNDCWKDMQSMKYARKHLGCCTCFGKIYAIGGRDANDDVIAKAEMYDPDLNSWTDIAPMNHKRAALGVVEARGNVYAIGGQGGSQDLNVVEAYDPKSDTWTSKESMNLKRLGLGTTVHTMSKHENSNRRGIPGRIS